MSDEEAHDALFKLAHSTTDAGLGGAEPPDKATADAGTWQGDAPQMPKFGDVSGMSSPGDLGRHAVELEDSLDDQGGEEGQTRIGGLRSLKSRLSGQPVAKSVDVQALEPTITGRGQAAMPAAAPKLEQEENPAMPAPRPAPPAATQPLGQNTPQYRREMAPGPLNPVEQPGDLAALQKKAKEGRANADMGHTIDALTDGPTNLLDYAQRLGGGGVTQAAPSKHWDRVAEEGDRDIEDRAALKKESAADAEMREKKDPNSDRAKIYREVLLKFAPEMADKLKNATPEQMETIESWLSKYYAENAQVLKAKHAAAAKPDNDPPLRALLLSPVYADALKAKGMTPEAVNSLSGKGLEDLVSQLKTDTTNKATVDAGRASSYIAAERGETYRRADKAEELARKQAEGMPPGIESINNNATEKDKEALKLALVGHADIKRLSNEMRDVLRQSGGLERMTGDARRELERIQAEMTIAAKNAGELGQITASDNALIDAIRPNATSGWSILRDTASFEKQLQGLEKWADNKVQAGMESRGFRRVGSKSAPADVGKKSGGTVQMKSRDGSLHAIPADRVREAETDPDEPLTRVR